MLRYYRAIITVSMVFNIGPASCFTHLDSGRSRKLDCEIRRDGQSEQPSTSDWSPRAADGLLLGLEQRQ